MKKLSFGPLVALLSSVAFAEDKGRSAEDDLQAYLEIGRESRVLLGEGEARITVSALAALDGTEFGIGSRSSTSYEGAVQVAYGVAKDIEIFASVPFGTFSSEARLLAIDTSDTGSGLGSIRLGARHVLLHETGDVPEINGSLQLGLPTQTYSETATSITGELSAITTLDPFLLNGNVGYTRSFGNDADRLDLSAGMVFGVSDRVALGADIAWSSDLSRVGDPLRDGLALTGRMAVTFGKSLIEPSIGIGLTEATPDVVLGVSWSRRF